MQGLRLSKVRCPYCHDGIDRGVEAVACSSCGASHHEECLLELGSCASCRAPRPRFAGRAATIAGSAEAPDDGVRFPFDAVDARGDRVQGVVHAADREDALQRIRAQGLLPTRVLPVRDDPASGRLSSFPYVARNGDGVRVEGVVRAPDRADAVRRLQAQGLTSIYVPRVAGPGEARRRRGRRPSPRATGTVRGAPRVGLTALLAAFGLLALLVAASLEGGDARIWQGLALGAGLSALLSWGRSPLGVVYGALLLVFGLSAFVGAESSRHVRVEHGTVVALGSASFALGMVFLAWSGVERLLRRP